MSPTLNNSPPAPFKSISFGPDLQFEEMTGVLSIILSVITFGKPSYFELNTNSFEFFKYGYGFEIFDN